MCASLFHDARCGIRPQSAGCRQLYEHVVLPSADGLKVDYSYILAQRIGDDKEISK